MKRRRTRLPGRQCWVPEEAAVMQSVIVSSSRDYTIRLWDARLGGEALSSLEGHMNEVTTVQWHTNGFQILSAGRDNQLKARPSCFQACTHSAGRN